MRPSLIFHAQRNTIREVASHFRVANVRIFGSVLEGTDREGSDLDLLVDALPETTLFDLGGLQMELESLLGIHVDVRTPTDLPSQFRTQVLAQAQPI